MFRVAIYLQINTQDIGRDIYILIEIAHPPCLAVLLHPIILHTRDQHAHYLTPNLMRSSDMRCYVASLVFVERGYLRLSLF